VKRIEKIEAEFEFESCFIEGRFCCACINPDSEDFLPDPDYTLKAGIKFCVKKILVGNAEHCHACCLC
jgi:hypothetical protein